MTHPIAKVKLGRKEFHVDCEEIDAGSCGISAADCAALGAWMEMGGFNRVKIMILFANNLGDKDAEAITEGLRFNTSVQELDLVNNKISIAGVCRLVSGILHNHRLTDVYFDHQASACICHHSWTGEGLPVPPDDVISGGWRDILEYLRESVHKKYDRLLSTAHAATLDCSAMWDQELMLSAISHAVVKNPAAVEVVLLSRNRLRPHYVPALAEQLSKFSALRGLELSANPGLGCGGAAAFLSALSGAVEIGLDFVSLSNAGLAAEKAPALAEQLGKFPGLRRLDVSANPCLDHAAVSLIINSLSSNAHPLHQRAVNFVQLNLSGIGAESLPDDIGHNLPRLRILILDNCDKLKFLPLQLGMIKVLESVSVKGCTALLYPPKSQRVDSKKMAKFLKTLHKNSVIWRRLKVVFLGNGRSGKTSLLRTLAKKPMQPDQQSTRGVIVDTFAGDLKPGFVTKWHHGFDLELSFWDFAGQLEYSAAHEFFMSTRQAIYVIVYSVLDDDESVMQQLMHWLSVIPEPAASPHVRLMIVGTKIDLVLSNEFQSELQSKRSVVHQVVEAKGLVHKIVEPDILFVSSLRSFAFQSSGLNLTWSTCRRALKDRMYNNCANIFECQDLQQQQLLKFPKECKDMKDLVERLKKKLRKKQALLCCKLDHEDAIKVLSKILDTKDKDQRKLYYNVDLVNMALDILNDLGIIVLYGGAGSLHAPETSPLSSASDSSASCVQSICLEPQFLPGIMSLLVDPQTRLPAVTTVGALINLMEQNHHISHISRTSPVDVKYQLLELLESVGIVRRYRDSENILVPLVLRGRPVSWSQIIRTTSRTLLLGWRLGVSATAFVPAASFMKLMLDKCADAERMWGCAFAYDVCTPGARVGASFVFVRLREDRQGVDVVAVMNEGQGSHDLVQREVDSIARMLGKDFNSASKRMHLCPMCCSADLFVRSGAVHAFHLQEVTAGFALRCSRYHDVTSSDVICGKLTKLDAGSLPIVYPSRIHELKLPWMLVAAGGILSLPAHREPYSKLESNEKFCSGAFLATSFFVLTGQVATGDVLHSDEIQRFNHIVTMCRNKLASSVHMFRVNDSHEIQLQFRYQQGDTLAILGDRKIQSIHPVYVGDDLSTTFDPSNTLDSFTCTDNVVVIFEKLSVESRSPYILFPGKGYDLLTCRLTPAACNASADAACCWSELQDYFSVVMGPEFQNYEITALTLFHNEDRARAFMRQVVGMKKRQRSAVPPWENRGRVAASALFEMGDAFAQYSEKFERDQFDWPNSCLMDDKELKNELERFGIHKMHTDQVLACVRQLQYTFEAQEATMRHLKDHTAAFGLLPSDENVDVNLTLAWWGNSKGNAVYELLAQNGFTKLPNSLKIDDGYYGEGFYFTRSPRYSDYYNCGFSLATRQVEGSFLMSFTLMGRPYPVTQHPFPKPATHQPPLHAQANALGNGLLGRSCNEQPHRCCGPDSHDSHYVTVRNHNGYHPCPPREQPDFDEVVVFNPANVLPAASFEFKRRRRVLLWLDDRPDRNIAILKQFPGCPLHKSLLHELAYPMRQHCDMCKHGLTMDSNPFGTLKERQKASREAAAAYGAAIKAAEDTPSDEAMEKEAAFERAMVEANKRVEEAHVVANAVTEQLRGQDIKSEDQVDVLLFLRVEDIAAFMSIHPELSNYPPSLLRIISSRNMLTADSTTGSTGLLQFLDVHPAWRFKFPALFVFYSSAAADFSETKGRPNLFKSTEVKHCAAFALFKPLALMPE